MNAAPVRVTLGKDGKRPRMLSRLVACDTLDGAVLCAQQWTVWGYAGRGGRGGKYSWYRVESRNGPTVWVDVASGTLADAQLVWTAEDEARVEAGPDVMELFPYKDEPKRRATRKGRARGKGTSRLAQLVSKVLENRQ